MRGEAMPEGVGGDLNPMFRAQIGQPLLDAPCPHAPAAITAIADEQGAVPSQLVGTGIQIYLNRRGDGGQLAREVIDELANGPRHQGQ